MSDRSGSRNRVARFARRLVGGLRGASRAVDRRRVGRFTLAVVIALVTAGGLAQVRIDTSMDSFLPPDSPEYQALHEKAQSFGGAPVVVLLKSKKPRQLMTDSDQLMRLLQLEGTLAKLPDVATVYGPATSLNQITGSIQNMMARLSGQRDALRNRAETEAKQSGASKQEASVAGRDAVARFDRHYGSLIVQHLDAGLPTLRNPGFVKSIVYNDHGQPRGLWDFLVPSKRTVTLLVRPHADLSQDAASQLTETVRNTVRQSDLATEQVTVTGVPAVTAGLTEHARQELPVLGGIALLGIGLIFVLVPWTSRRRSRLRPPIAAILGTAMTVAAFGWLDHAVSLGVVAFLPILLGIGSDFPLYLSQPGRRRRVLVTSLAAALGFASLTLSPLPFVRELGIALAVGIGLTVGVALILRRWFDASPPTQTGTSSAIGATPRPSWWRRGSVLVAVLGVAAAGWAALPHLDTEGGIDDLARGLPELNQVRHAEDVLGSSGEVSVLMRGNDVTRPEVLDWARQAENTLVREHGGELTPIITVTDMLSFLGGNPTPQQIAAAVDLLPQYLTSSVIGPDQHKALMVFGVELQDLEQQSTMLDQVRRSLPPTPQGLHAELVGLPVAAVAGFDLVSGERGLVNIAGILAAGIALAIGLRHRRDAARAMLTVVLATGWVLGVVWLASGALNPLTLVIGSLTTATGCEFAVMLTNARRRGIRSLRRSVMVAVMAGTVGYLVLALSAIAMLREFGLLLAGSVVASYLAAQVVVWIFRPAPERDPATATPGRHLPQLPTQMEVTQ